MYSYFGYSRKEKQTFAYLKTKSTNCEKKFPTMHRVPKYFGFYLGKDAYHTPYNGKFAFVYLMAGPGSFRDGKFDEFGPFLDGAKGLMPKPSEFSKPDVIEVAHDEKDSFVEVLSEDESLGVEG